MKLVFLSNYFSHHQKPLADALAKQTEYAFVATEPMTQERLSLGWGLEEPGYVCHHDREPQRVKALLDGADIVIAGSAPAELVKYAVAQEKIILRYSERPLKEGNQWSKYLPRLIKWHFRNPPGKPIYLLCAGAYVAGDYHRFGLFRGKAFRWGYFPEAKYDSDPAALMQRKDPARILWAGRFLDWKHPDDAIRVAALLKRAGVDFQMELIGRGALEDTLRQMIEEEGLTSCVRLLGPMKPEEVRRCMEKAEIFLFTSDRQEGWGAVLNEAMNSGCAVVASDAIGSVPYLLRHKENGCVYHSGNAEELARQIRELLEDKRLCRQLGEAAYRTISEQWNPEIAAGRLICLAEKLLAGEKRPALYENGPCSPAPMIREDWFKK